MIHNINPAIEEYFLQQYEKQQVRVVWGHWPKMNTKQDVDAWIKSLNTLQSCLDKLNKKEKETKS